MYILSWNGQFVEKQHANSCKLIKKMKFAKANLSKRWLLIFQRMAYIFTFTFMHVMNAFSQSELQSVAYMLHFIIG